MQSSSRVLTLLALVLVSAAILHAQLDLTVRKDHSPDTFFRGGTGTYTIVVSNSSTEPAKPPQKPKGKKGDDDDGDDDDGDDDDDSSAGLPTSASITVIDTLPLGLTATGASGNGWNCRGIQVVTCTTSQIIAAGSNATPITLDVSVAFDAPTPAVTNTVRVLGGGELPPQAGNNVSTDDTPIAENASVTLSLLGDPLPGGQNQVTLELSREFPQNVTGEVALTFTPHASLPGNMDDPAIQFSTGGRTVGFTVPRGSTQGRFSGGNLMLQLGTVAGTIRLVLTKMQAGSSDLTPSPPTTREIVINRMAPVIREVRITNRTASDFTVEVVGFATSREITQALFQFNPAPGAELAAGQATIQLNQPAQSWYESQASRQFGSQFVYAQPFTVEGAASAIRSLVVTVSNSLGNSASTRASF